MATKNTIAGTLGWAAAFILNRPTQGIAGFYQEPGLTLANLIMSTILAPPFAWQWNRNNNTFVTVVGQADYVVAIADFGWLEKATITSSSDTVPVVEIEIAPMLSASGQTGTPFQIAIVNDDNAGNITFRLLSVPDEIYTVTLAYQKAPIFASSLYGASLGSITGVAAASGGLTTYTASGGFTGGTANGLAGTYLFSSGNAAAANNGLYYCTASSATTVTLQNPGGLLATCSSGSCGIIQSATTWAPIPDKYNFLYERGMLAHLHAMYDAATYLQELQLFFRQLVGCSEGLSDTAKAIFLEDRLSQLRTEAAAQSATTAAPKRAQ